MRPAEILAEWLLSEARPTVIAVGYGPGLPEQGYFAHGATESEVLKRFAEAIKSLGPGQPADVKELVQLWVIRGYSFLLDDGGGSFFYGDKTVHVSDQVAYMFSLKPNTQVMRAVRKPQGGFSWTTETASTLLGVL